MSPESYEQVTPEKIEYVELQANKMHSFVMESRGILAKEAHTTLNWLFGIVVGSAGYIIAILREKDRDSDWLLIPLLVALAIGMVAAGRFFYQSMRIKPVFPSGNEPRNLLTDQMMDRDIEDIRFSEVQSIQVRIDAARAHNAGVANAINEARIMIVCTPVIAILVAICCLLFR